MATAPAMPRLACPEEAHATLHVVQRARERRACFSCARYRANALGEDDALLTPHPHYYSLGRSPDERRAAYAALFARTGERITPVSRPRSGSLSSRARSRS